MPQVSHRGSAMPASPIRKLAPFAEAAKKKGTKVYHLNIGQPDIETPASIIEAVKNTSFKVLEYSPSQGFESYRKALAGYYQSKNINVDENEIIITTGGSEAISFALMATMNPGDEIIIPEPFYANYNGFAVAAGITVKPIPSSIEDNFKLPSIEAFESAITPNTKGIMICNPNNPTGYLYSKEELETLKTLALKYELFIYSDEAYREFCYDGKKHYSVMELEGLEEHAILLDTISKRYSACGARIGALVTKNKAVYNAALKFAQARLSPPTFEQILGEAACALPEDYFNEVLAEYQLRRDTLINGLKTIEGVTVPNPGGAFYVMVKLPIEDAEDFCKWILSEYSYNGATVMMAQGNGFYSTPGSGNNEVRLAYVLNKTDIENAIEVLRHAIVAYQNK